MKYWVASLLFILFSLGANATSATDSFIAKKRMEARQAKSESAGNIDYLRNNKDKANIIGTTPHYNLGDLETASGGQAPATEEETQPVMLQPQNAQNFTQAPAQHAGTLSATTKEEAPVIPRLAE